MSLRGCALIAVLIAACGAPETIKLPNGATAYPLACLRLEQCEERARQICKRLDYFVHEKTEYRPTEVYKKPHEWTGASSIGDVGAGSKMQSDAEKQPYWRLVVECKPPADEIHSRLVIKENTAEVEKGKREYMEAVCELRDPDNRREQLEIARQRYGDVSCDE
jgi:hypothetical protein